jgi:hypothetical protein
MRGRDLREGESEVVGGLFRGRTWGQCASGKRPRKASLPGTGMHPGGQLRRRSIAASVNIWYDICSHWHVASLTATLVAPVMSKGDDLRSGHAAARIFAGRAWRPVGPGATRSRRALIINFISAAAAVD